MKGGRITLILGMGINNKAFLMWYRLDHWATPNTGCNNLIKFDHFHLLKIKVRLWKIL